MHALAAFVTGIFLAIGSWLGIAHPQQGPIAYFTLSADSSASSSTSNAVLPPEELALASSSTSTAASQFARGASTTIPNGALPDGSPWLTTLPLGDGLYTTTKPKAGYVYLCDVAPAGSGAEGNPPWIHGTTWSPGEKAVAQGAVSWPSATYSMHLSRLQRLISGNGLPVDHPTGIFPIQKSDPAYAIDTNPNAIEAETISLTLPEVPALLTGPACIYQEVGIMNDGVALFDAFDAEYRDALAHEVQDEWEGHPDAAGVYHNHGFETYFVKESVETVIGFAYDGFPITGSRLPSGNYLHTPDLDECHGITSPVALDGTEVSIYHYVLTQDFPYSVSCFRAASHEPRPGASAAPPLIESSGGAPPPGANGEQPAPPPGAIAACDGIPSGGSCTIQNGPSGTCQEVGSYFACVPQ